MKRMLMTALAAASLAAAVTPALAQPAGARINDREARIAERIDQGARNGDLTRREAWNMKRELLAIERMEQRYRGYDHRMNYRERADLERRLDALSARVFANRHDGDRRDWRDHQDRHDRYNR
jgi:hypothetical protein